MVYLVKLLVTQDYVASNDWMMVNNELERISEEAVVISFKVLSRHLPGSTEEYHEKSHSSYLVAQPRLETAIF
jgi:hypothetical protein